MGSSIKVSYLCVRPSYPIIKVPRCKPSQILRGIQFKVKFRHQGGVKTLPLSPASEIALVLNY